jgi:hypothetical protein
MTTPGQQTADDVGRLTRELNEAREQQAAIRDVLSVMSNSPGDVKPVFETVARHAARICEAEIVDMVVVKDNALHYGAEFGDAARTIRDEAIPINRDSVVGRSVVDKQAIQVADLLSPDHDFTLGREFALRWRCRSCATIARSARS